VACEAAALDIGASFTTTVGTIWWQQSKTSRSAERFIHQGGDIGQMFEGASQTPLGGARRLAVRPKPATQIDYWGSVDFPQFDADDLAAIERKFCAPNRIFIETGSRFS
jgi:hypothetical protein